MLLAVTACAATRWTRPTTRRPAIAGYDGAVDPDHVPPSDADPSRSQAYAQGYGYILGMIAAAEHRG